MESRPPRATRLSNPKSCAMSRGLSSNSTLPPGSDLARPAEPSRAKRAFGKAYLAKLLDVRYFLGEARRAFPALCARSTAGLSGRLFLFAMRAEIILHSLPYLLQAAGVTIALSVAGIALGFAIGALVCVARLSGVPSLERLGGFYVSFFRGVPLLVQLLFIYYFLAEYGLDVPALVAAIGGLALSSGTYQAEILRGALNAVPGGQAEAATALGFPPLDIWRRILLPQALRISAPPLINEFILLLKASSLVSAVGIAELTRVSMNIASMTYRPFEAYLGGGLIYLAINLCLAGFGAFAERRLATGRTP
jgi:polar amino acid transport system permease protein